MPSYIHLPSSSATRDENSGVAASAASLRSWISFSISVMSLSRRAIFSRSSPLPRASISWVLASLRSANCSSVLRYWWVSALSSVSLSIA